MLWKQLTGGLLLSAILGFVSWVHAASERDWGEDRLLSEGIVGPYGISADRTSGPDTAFVGVILKGGDSDTIRIYRTINGGEDWTQFWQTFSDDLMFSNLNLSVCSGSEGWVTVFWIATGPGSNGDVKGVRIALDGEPVETLDLMTTNPTDTITGLAVVRGTNPPGRLYLFWQDEQGLTGSRRRPLIWFRRTGDYGLNWSRPVALFEGFDTPSADAGAPGQVYLALRDIRRRDIAIAVSTDDGDQWQLRELTSDSTAYDDLFPSVAATHDTSLHGPPNPFVWVSYDSYRAAAGWDIRYAYSTNNGTTWVLDRVMAGGSDVQILSRLASDGYCSRRTRVVYVGDKGDFSRIYYRECTGASPTAWSEAIAIGDNVASVAQAPVITSIGVAGDTLAQGLLFYAGQGDFRLWYDAGRFSAVKDTRGRAPQAQTRTAVWQQRGLLEVRFTPSSDGIACLTLWDATGRRIGIRQSACRAGERTIWQVPTGNWAGRTLFVRLDAGQESSFSKVFVVR